eukprot:3885159-Prymnesium_polylepis.1
MFARGPMQCWMAIGSGLASRKCMHAAAARAMSTGGPPQEGARLTTPRPHAFSSAGRWRTAHDP